ncbi:SMP-30/gluconolactonase/LRE family protein [Zavarzinia sp. CC-PAN008]|uniref:SMP-30/gluconolactonase/LRE family protein n=1 Tax=Zavarzinia sp. CC-PAN008 TaxID=3243332 RepID=UPI003F74A4B3
MLDPAAYPEGPLWWRGKLLFTEMSGERVAEWDGTAVKTFWSGANLGETCGPTAVVPFRERDLVVLCHLAGKLVLLDETGKAWATLDSDANGTSFVDPNDATTDGAGGLYFSDAGMFAKGAPATGSVVHVDREGVATRVVEGLNYANGVLYDAARGELIVDEHLARRVLAYPVAADRRLGPPRVLADLDALGVPARFDYRESGPDGLERDADGVLWVCEYGQGRIWRFAADGSFLDVVTVPTQYLTNIAFDGDRVALTGSFDNMTEPRPGRVWIADRKELVGR